MESQNRTLDSVYLCPRLRYVKCFADSFLRDFKQAIHPKDKDRALNRCLDHAKLILWVIEPMTKDLGLPEHASELNAIAQRLTSLAGIHWESHPSNFVPDDGRQLIVDRLDEIERKLSELMARALSHHRPANIVAVNFQGKGAA